MPLVEKRSFINDFIQPMDQLPPPQDPEGDAQARRELKAKYMKERFFSQLGFDFDKEGFQYSDGNRKTLRIVELGEEGQPFKDPFADGTKPVSDEFIDKIMKGKILVFPVGEKHPVQLQLNGKTSDFNYSKPVTELPARSKLPDPPKPIGGWRRFANIITFGRAYKADFQKYETEKYEYESLRDQWNQSQEPLEDALEERTDEVLAQEKQQFEKEWAEHERKEAEAKKTAEENALKEDVKAIRANQYKGSYLDKFEKTYRGFYGAAPEKNPKWIERIVYREEDYKKLEHFDLEGTGISDEEFAAVALMRVTDGELGGQIYKEKTPNLTGEERAPSVIDFVTETAVQHNSDGEPREGMNKFFDDAIVPARKDAYDAIREYKDPKNPNPDKLASYIASGMNFYLTKYNHNIPDNMKSLSTVGQMAYCLDLMEKDPALKEKVMAQKGKDGKPLITKQDLTTVKGLRTVKELSRRNDEAKQMLRAERMGVTTLTDEERKGYIRDRLAFETVNRVAESYYNRVRNSKKYKEGETQLGQQLYEAGVNLEKVAKRLQTTKYADNEDLLANKKDPEYIEAEHKKDLIQNELCLYEQKNLGVPDVDGMLGSMGQKYLDAEIANQLPNYEKLYSLKGEELEKALESKTLFAKDSPYAREKEPEKNGPEKEEPKKEELEKEGPQQGGPQQGSSVKDRAKMFEKKIMQ